MIRMYFVIIGLCFCDIVIGQEMGKTNAKEVMVEANRHFQTNEYDEAIEMYGRLAETYQSTPLYHNLALSYYYTDRLGEAILNMERAKRHSPMNNNVKKNLKLLYENVDSEVQNLPPFFLRAWFNSISVLFSPLIWLIIHFLLLFAGIAFLYLYLMKDFDFGLHFYYIRGTIIGIFVLALLTALFAYNSQALKYSDVSAVVMEDKVELRAGAEGNAQEIGVLNEGMKVKIEDVVNNFYKVRLGDYTEGWVLSESLERI